MRLLLLLAYDVIVTMTALHTDVTAIFISIDFVCDTAFVAKTSYNNPFSGYLSKILNFLHLIQSITSSWFSF